MPSDRPIFHDRVMRAPPRLRMLSVLGAVAPAAAFIVFLSVSYFILCPLFRSLP